MYIQLALTNFNLVNYVILHYVHTLNKKDIFIMIDDAHAHVLKLGWEPVASADWAILILVIQGDAKKHSNLWRKIQEKK